MLQERMKWYKFRRNVGIRDIVPVLDDSIPICSWPLGGVLDIYSNKHDRCVRFARVKIKSGTLLRLINKL